MVVPLHLEIGHPAVPLGGLDPGMPQEILDGHQGGVRHEGGVNLNQALARNVGKCRPDVKGEAQVEDPQGARVPMRGTAAEQLVVAKKCRNGDGAKGLCRSALPGGQPAMGGAIG